MSFIASFKDVSYKSDKHNIVDDVTFDLEKGSVTTLIGPNGSGKSTIAKLLLGIKKPTNGKINSRIKTFSYVPQKLGINSDLPVNASKLLYFLSPNYESNKFYTNLIEFMDFDNIKNKLIDELSGGQLQRLLISSAIFKNTELLVLDEPTKCLDISSQKDFYKLLKLIREENGTTIFLVSHDLFTVMNQTDQVLCLNKHVCCAGKPTRTIVKGLENISVYHHDHNNR